MLHEGHYTHQYFDIKPGHVRRPETAIRWSEGLPAEWREQVIAPLYFDHYKEYLVKADGFAAQVKIAPEAVRSFYDGNQKDFLLLGNLAVPMAGRKPNSQSGKSMRRRREFMCSGFVGSGGEL